jgi:hypothetical protein
LEETRTSEVLNLGPDHFVRLTAVKRLIDLLLASRPVPKHVPATEDSPRMTLEQLQFWADRYYAKQSPNQQAPKEPQNL